MALNDIFDISVVIPLYNHERYISETLDSVLGQSRLPEEIIVVDDGSSDASLAIAREKLRGCQYATVVTQANAGAHAAINRAIEMATSRFIAVLNSDDNFLPQKIERVAELIGKEVIPPELIFGGVTLIDDQGREIAEGVTNDWLDRSYRFLARAGRLDIALLNENFAVTTSNMVFTKSIWQRNQGFQALRYCHDLDFYFAANRNGRIVYDHDVKHIQYRVHPTNTIKENLNRVRVELAAVLACGLADSILTPDSKEFSSRELALIDEILTSKGLGNLLPIMVAQHGQFDGRAGFYNWAIAPGKVNETLINILAGTVAPPEPVQESPLSVYTSGQLTTEVPQAKIEKVSFPGPIAIELGSFDRGGLEKVVLDTSIAMREFGVESIIISCGKVGHLGDVAKKAGITVYELPKTDPEKFYADILRRHSVKIAVSHFSRVGYPVFAREGIPNVTFIHNVYAFLSGQALENFKQDDIYVSAYISVSPNATAYAVHKLGIQENKISTIPNGLIIKEHEKRAREAQPATRSQFGISQDDYLFLNVASYNLHKGHYLLAAAMKLVKTRTENIKVLCIGNTVVPQHFIEFDQYLRENNLEKNIILPGYFPDIAAFHKLSDAYIMPSFIEGWSIAMNEAMYFGKPMILTDTGGAAEVIENEDIGILLPNEYGDSTNLNSEQLDYLAYHRRNYRTAAHVANAMIRFYENSEYWRRAGLKGKAKIVGKYDFHEMVRSYFPVFDRVLAAGVRDGI